MVSSLRRLRSQASAFGLRPAAGRAVVLRAVAAAVLLLAASGCNFSLTDYPYCFGCDAGTDCPLGTVCGGDSFCHYPCQRDGGCAVQNAACGRDHFCHAADHGGC